MTAAATNARARALIELHLAVGMFGFAALFGKWIALAPIEIVLGRTVIAAATLFAVLRWRSRRVRPPDLGLAFNGALLAFHWVAFFTAVQVASVAVALIGYSTFPAFAMLLDRRARSGRERRDEWIAILLVVAGLVLVVPRFDFSDRAVHGLVWGVVSGLSFAWLVLRNQRKLATRGAIELALWQNSFAAVVLVLVPVVTPMYLKVASLRDLALMVVLGAICTAVAHTLFIACLTRLTVHTASVVSALEPVYGIALAVVLLGEIPGARTLLGAALVVAAAIVASRQEPDSGSASLAHEREA